MERGLFLVHVEHQFGMIRHSLEPVLIADVLSPASQPYAPREALQGAGKHHDAEQNQKRREVVGPEDIGEAEMPNKIAPGLAICFNICILPGTLGQYGPNQREQGDNNHQHYRNPCRGEQISDEPEDSHWPNSTQSVIDTHFEKGAVPFIKSSRYLLHAMNLAIDLS
jgi:hypothetical protein